MKKMAGMALMGGGKWKERITGHLETNPLAINFTAIE